MNTINQRVIKNKLGLLNLKEEIGNLSEACKVMRLSRDTFYHYQSTVAEGHVEALLDKNRRQPNIKKQVEESVEKAVVAYAIDYLTYGQRRVSNELKK
ncbi:helix-turn-helix domain-containing protein [Fastidiosibacter lacustris]|uniref:helix-turn-helix domain-containing protein n=1 Tax=Fastidiosibacter lacustris TaxID=2056695 RepID=UPI000E3497BF